MKIFKEHELKNPNYPNRKRVVSRHRNGPANLQRKAEHGERLERRRLGLGENADYARLREEKLKRKAAHV